VSKAYLGKISVKALTVYCENLDRIPFNSMIMADKGINICNECEQRGISLYVPHGKRCHSQMTSSAVFDTKRISNNRIIIEQVIRRLKTFKILANEHFISMISHMMPCCGICAAFCNFREPMYTF